MYACKEPTCTREFPKQISADRHWTFTHGPHARGKKVQTERIPTVGLEAVPTESLVTLREAILALEAKMSACQEVITFLKVLERQK